MNVLFHVYKLLLVFLSLKLYMYCFLSSKKKLVYRGLFRVCCEGTWFLVFEERCTPWACINHPHQPSPMKQRSMAHSSCNPKQEVTLFLA